MKSFAVRLPPIAPPLGPRCAAAPSKELSSSPTVMKEPRSLSARWEATSKLTAPWLSEPELAPPKARAVGRLMKWQAQVSCRHSALWARVPGLKTIETLFEPALTIQSWHGRVGWKAKPRGTESISRSAPASTVYVGATPTPNSSTSSAPAAFRLAAGQKQPLSCPASPPELGRSVQSSASSSAGRAVRRTASGPRRAISTLPPFCS